MYVCLMYIIYNWTFLANATQININTDSDIIVKGENLRLNCTVTTFFDDSLIINWKLTDKQKLRVRYLFNNKMFRMETS